MNTDEVWTRRRADRVPANHSNSPRLGLPQRDAKYRPQRSTPRIYIRNSPYQPGRRRLTAHDRRVFPGETLRRKSRDRFHPEKRNMRQTRIPKQIIRGVIGICILPFLLNLAGVDLGTSNTAPHWHVGAPKVRDGNSRSSSRRRFSFISCVSVSDFPGGTCSLP